MKHLTIILFALMMATVIATSASADTVTISGPSQVQDAALRSDGVDVNMGQNGDDRSWRMFPDTNAIKRHNLMRFDLSGLAGMQINSATMGIYIRNYNTPADVTGYQISRLKAGKSWIEGTNSWQNPAYAGDVTWNSQAHDSILWATPGATGAADIDLATSISWNLTADTIGQYVTFDLTAFVREWANGSWENNGILFWGGSAPYDDPGAYYWGYSSESAATDRVPYLFVDYTVPEPSSLVALAGFGLAGLGFVRRRRS